MNWLRHAFAVDPPGPAEPTPPQRRVVDTVCREIVRRHLTTPALLFFELARPLNFVGAQTLHFLQPVLSLLKDAGQIREFAYYLERRGSVEYICRRIEELERLAEGRELATGEPPEELLRDTPGRHGRTEEHTAQSTASDYSTCQ